MASAFGKELRMLRKAAKLNLVDLANALDCSVAYISAVERGEKNPPGPDAIHKLLVRLGRPDQFANMVTLAIRSRNTIEIPLKNVSDSLANALVSLARRCDAGEAISPEEEDQVMILVNLSGRPPQDGDKKK